MDSGGEGDLMTSVASRPRSMSHPNRGSAPGPPLGGQTSRPWALLLSGARGERRRASSASLRYPARAASSLAARLHRRRRPAPAAARSRRRGPPACVRHSRPHRLLSPARIRKADQALPALELVGRTHRAEGGRCQVPCEASRSNNNTILPRVSLWLDKQPVLFSVAQHGERIRAGRRVHARA